MINLHIAVAALAARCDHGQGLPLCWWGDPGLAKTAMLETLASWIGIHLEAIPCGVYDPSEFNGMAVIDAVPVPGADGKPLLNELGKPRMAKVVRFSPSRWARSAVAADLALVFLDEITTATPATQQALLRVINERWSGDLKLGENVMFMLAGNPASQNGGHDLIQPMANRVGHVNVTFTEDMARKWAKWRRGKAVNFLEGVTVLTKAQLDVAWDAEFAQVADLIADYIDAFPKELHQKPLDDDPQASRAWPSMRTWDYMTSALTSARLHLLSPEDTDEFCGAFIGSVSWDAFVTWYNDRQAEAMPDAEDFLDGGCKDWVHDSKRPDRTVAVLAQCVSAVKDPTCVRRLKRTKAFIKWLTTLAAGTDIDIVVAPYGELVMAGLISHKNPAPVALQKRIERILGGV